MRVSILAVCEIIAIFCLFSLGGITGAGMPRTSDEPQKSAQQLWEEALAAKGGRERLYEVRNLVVLEGSKNRHVDLYVFPDRIWRWMDDSHTPIGLSVDMYDIRRNLIYMTSATAPQSPQRVENNGTGEAVIREAQLYFLMETKWLKPQLIKATKGRFRGESVDIVRALVNGNEVGYALDRKTHLPKGVLNYSNPNEDKFYSSVAFSDYADVNGIQMPQKVNYDDTSFIRQTYEINVDYNEEVFEKPPTIEAGPDAWRPAKGNSHQEPKPMPQHAGSETAEIRSYIQALESEDESVRDAAVESLVKIGPAANPSLTEALKSGKDYTRIAAARAMNEIDPDNKATVSTLFSLVKDKEVDPTLRRLAAYVMALSTHGVLALKELLKDDDIFVRRSAAFAFEELTETRQHASPSVLSAIKASIPMLVEALKDRDEIVSGVAAEGLEQIGTDAIPHLRAAAKSEDKNLRTAAAKLLQQIEKGVN